MNKYLKVLTAVALTVSLFPSFTGTAKAVGERPLETDYELGEWAFTDSKGYFKDMSFNLREAVRSYPANYIYEETEIAIFYPDGKLFNYVGAVKNATDNIVSFDLGNPKSYTFGQTYEVKYRLVFTVLTTELQYKKSDWKSYDPDETDPTDGDNSAFSVVVPFPTSPDANPLANKSQVESTDSTFINKRITSGTAGDNPRLDGESNTLVLTDKNDVTLNYVTDAWYTHRVERVIDIGEKKHDNEVFYADPDNQRQLAKTEILPLDADITQKSYGMKNELYREDGENPDFPMYSFKDKANITIVRNIFNKLFDMNITMNGDTYGVTLKQKTTLTEEEKAVLNNSYSSFGINLNTPKFVVTEDTFSNISDYENSTLVNALGVETTTTCADCKNPILRIGYPGMVGNSYTLNMPLKEVLGINFSNIPDEGVLNINTGIFKPEVSVKANNNVFKFPAGTSFSWENYVDLQTELSYFIYPVTNSASVPTDKTDFFKNPTNYVFKDDGIQVVKDKGTDTLSSLALTDSGTYIIGAKMTNKYGEIVYNFKEFKLLFNSEFGYMPVKNNQNYQFDDKVIVANGKITNHEMSLVSEDSSLTSSASYNFKQNIVALGSKTGSGSFFKVFDTSLEEVAINSTLPADTKVNQIIEYQDGFLLGLESASDVTLGLAYYDNGTKTIIAIESAEKVRDIEIENGIIYIASEDKLSVGKLDKTNYTELDSLTAKDVFDNDTDKLGELEINGAKILISPQTDFGIKPSNLAIIDKI